MSDVKSDIQIAREAKMQPINDILAKINVPDESAAFSPMGRHIAKINLENGKKFANLVKNSNTYIINGSGHMIMIEKAFEMREKILEFLNK